MKEEMMKVYHHNLNILIPRFEKLTFTHLLLESNRFPNTLAALASMVDILVEVKIVTTKPFHVSCIFNCSGIDVISYVLV